MYDSTKYKIKNTKWPNQLKKTPKNTILFFSFMVFYSIVKTYKVTRYKCVVEQVIQLVLDVPKSRAQSLTIRKFQISK